MMENSMRQARGLDRSAQEALQKLDQEVALYIIKNQMEHLKPVYRTARVLAYLEQVYRHAGAYLDFKADPEEQADAQLPFPILPGRSTGRKYAVNILVDNSNMEGAPSFWRDPLTAIYLGASSRSPVGALTTDLP
jgi:hypothetical protein